MTDPIPVAIEDIPIWPTVRREGDRYEPPTFASSAPTESHSRLQ
jgi:hypothetical protein